MEVFILAAWIAFFGYLAHRRRLRDQEAQTELMPTQPWRPEQPETMLWIPEHTRKPSEPTHEPWADVGIAGFALIALGVTLAMVIVAVGLM